MMYLVIDVYSGGGPRNVLRVDVRRVMMVVHSRKILAPAPKRIFSYFNVASRLLAMYITSCVFFLSSWAWWRRFSFRALLFF